MAPTASALLVALIKCLQSLVLLQKDSKTHNRLLSRQKDITMARRYVTDIPEPNRRHIQFVG